MTTYAGRDLLAQLQQIHSQLSSGYGWEGQAAHRFGGSLDRAIALGQNAQWETEHHEARIRHLMASVGLAR